MNLQKLIEKLEEFIEYWQSLPSTFIAYYDDLYGYPWGRLQLFGMMCLGFAFYFGLLNLILELN
jgi:hypothetical protein